LIKKREKNLSVHLGNIKLLCFVSDTDRNKGVITNTSSKSINVCGCPKEPAHLRVEQVVVKGI
jgi:hypothetical protein